MDISGKNVKPIRIHNLTIEASEFVFAPDLFIRHADGRWISLRWSMSRAIEITSNCAVTMDAKEMSVQTDMPAPSAAGEVQ